MNEIKLDCLESSVLSFVVVISSFRFSFTQFLTFLNTLASYRKIFEASIIANDLS